MSDAEKLTELLRSRAKTLNLPAIGFGRHAGRYAVCCLFPYYHEDGPSRLSIYARSRDYHVIVVEKLRELMAPVDASAEIFVDKGPHEDIEVAVKCGLGIVGRNGLLIHPSLGSFCFIGYTLTARSLIPSSPLGGTCLSCNACLRSCPGNALSANGSFDASRCASALTQKKGALTDEEKSIIRKSGYVFGCDICQTVCPHNCTACAMNEFLTNRITSLSSKTLSSMSNADFRSSYGNYAFAWRGKAVLLRNLALFGE